jgi:uncharacterized protein YwgA
MESKSLVRALLELIAAAGGETDTRIRIQKEAFLLAAKGLGDFPIHGFDYHHFGPFSRALSNALHTTVNLGLVDEVKEDFESGIQKYKYKLTDDGKSWIQQNSPRFEQLKSIVDRLASEHWRTLELAATAVFFEKKGTAMSRSAAVEETIKKKPETRPFEHQARQLLEDLAL